MNTIIAEQIAVADNPHGVDVRHLYSTPDVVVSQITLEPGEVVKPHKAPVDAFFYVLEGAPLGLLSDTAAVSWASNAAGTSQRRGKRTTGGAAWWFHQLMPRASEEA